MPEKKSKLVDRLELNILAAVIEINWRRLAENASSNFKDSPDAKVYLWNKTGVYAVSVMNGEVFTVVNKFLEMRKGGAIYIRTK